MVHRLEMHCQVQNILCLVIWQLCYTEIVIGLVEDSEHVRISVWLGLLLHLGLLALVAAWKLLDLEREIGRTIFAVAFSK